MSATSHEPTPVTHWQPARRQLGMQRLQPLPAAVELPEMVTTIHIWPAVNTSGSAASILYAASARNSNVTVESCQLHKQLHAHRHRASSNARWRDNAIRTGRQTLTGARVELQRGGAGPAERDVHRSRAAAGGAHAHRRRQHGHRACTRAQRRDTAVSETAVEQLTSQRSQHSKRNEAEASLFVSYR